MNSSLGLVTSAGGFPPDGGLSIYVNGGLDTSAGGFPPPPCGLSAGLLEMISSLRPEAPICCPFLVMLKLGNLDSAGDTYPKPVPV